MVRCGVRGRGRVGRSEERNEQKKENGKERNQKEKKKQERPTKPEIDSNRVNSQHQVNHRHLQVHRRPTLSLGSTIVVVVMTVRGNAINGS